MSDFIQFDQGKPFYDMVANFMVALSAAPAVFNEGNPMNYRKGDYISFNGVQIDSKHLIPYDVYEAAQSGHTTLSRFVGYSCMTLANLAFESVKRQNDHSPEFEFFRHVRNASSHKNRFVFAPKEPRLPARWRTAVLDHTKIGDANPLQGQQCFGPLLGPADIVQLLADIEPRIGG